MASTSGPIVSPLSPAIKRSTRKRQRPTFFAEEIEAVSASTSASSRKHSTRTTRQRQQQQPSQRTEPATKRHHHAHRSDISQLHDTVSDLRAQIESATIQMQELRSLVSMLADLYRAEEDADEEEDIFSTPLSPLLE